LPNPPSSLVIIIVFIVKNQLCQPRIYARRGEKHSADRYCAGNILMLLSPVGDCETFYEQEQRMHSSQLGVFAYLLQDK